MSGQRHLTAMSSFGVIAVPRTGDVGVVGVYRMSKPAPDGADQRQVTPNWLGEMPLNQARHPADESAHFAEQRRMQLFQARNTKSVVRVFIGVHEALVHRDQLVTQLVRNKPFAHDQASQDLFSRKQWAT